MARRMSMELRIELEMLLESMMLDAPYLNPDAVNRMRKILGLKEGEELADLTQQKEKESER